MKSRKKDIEIYKTNFQNYQKVFKVELQNDCTTSTYCQNFMETQFPFSTAGLVTLGAYPNIGTCEHYHFTSLFYLSRKPVLVNKSRDVSDCRPDIKSRHEGKQKL